MGFLADSQPQGANALGGASLGWGQLATDAAAAGPIVGGIGGWQQANYMASIARNNAAIQRQNAATDLSAGQFGSSMALLQAGKTAAQQRAAQGANNIDVNVGSAKATQDETENMGSLDAAIIHYNAARQAFGAETAAATLDTQAKLDKISGINSALSGIAKGANSYITGASSLSSKWQQYQLSGVNP